MTNEQIITRIKAGIDTANNTALLWQQNQGLINKIVNRYKDYGEEEDLQQEAFLGLCNAIDHFEPEEGTLFMSYAGYWIKQKIVRYIKQNSTVRIPEYTQDQIQAYKKMISSWSVKFNREPTDREIREYLGLNREQLDQLRKNLNMTKIRSLDEPLGNEEDVMQYDLIPGSEGIEDSVLDKVQKEQLRKVLWSLVDSLPGQQPAAIRERFQNDKTLEDTGKALGVTKDRAHTIVSNGLKELRKPSRSKQLRPFLYDEIYNRALHGNGVERFRQTWTSSTERVALKMVCEE